MRHRLGLVLGLLLTGMAASVHAAEWGLIRPGVSTTETYNPLPAGDSHE